MIKRLIVILLLSLFCSSYIEAQSQDKIPAKTGSVDIPEWENSPEFQESIIKAGTFIRMATFSATLKDPLPGEMYNVAHAARILAGTTIQPGEIFSQNRALGPYSTQKGYLKGPTYLGSRVILTIGGGVCKIASVMYNVVRLSNLQVIERHNHSLTVPYVPAGQDATVSYGCRDFRFRNNSTGPVMLWAATYGNTLQMALYGQQLPPVVKWHHQTLKRIKTWTIRRYNPALPPDIEKVLAPGQDGIVVKTWLEINYFDGTEEIKYLGKNYYSPSPRIIEYGPEGNG